MVAKALRKVQVGEETTYGTEVNPTVQLSGITDVQISLSDYADQIVPELRGSQGPGLNTYTPSRVGRGTISQMMSAEHSPYLLNTLMSGAVSGSGPYTWTWDAPLATDATLYKQTIVVGDGTSIYNLTSAYATGLTISSAWGEPWNMTVELMAHSVDDDSLASLSDVAVTYALGGQTSVYIDAWGGTIGNTQFTGAWAFDVSFNPNRQILARLGSLYPSGAFDQPWSVTGSLTLEEGATSVGFITAMLDAATKKLIRIKTTNGGAGTAERSITIDLAVLLHVADIFTDENGLATCKFNFECIEETSGTDWFAKIIVVNNTADLYP